MRMFSCQFGTGMGGSHPFQKIVTSLIAVEHPDQLKPGGFLTIWGGSDISPMIYQRHNVASYVSNYSLRRDVAEIELIERAVDLGLPVLGVCRGAQLCCALAGGILAQDVDNHGNNHCITTSDGRVLTTSSVHHQMMYPYGVEHELLAWTSRPLSGHYAGLTAEEAAVMRKRGEPEVVWFPEKKFLAVQGHPEFMREDCAFNDYIRELLVKYVVEVESVH